MQFGDALRDWRDRRRRSQLDLSLSANVSARHISFLETGRARPSRSMVLALCAELDVPRPDRNRLLVAAGFAPLYRARDWQAEDMAPARAAITGVPQAMASTVTRGPPSQVDAQTTARLAR